MARFLRRSDNSVWIRVLITVWCLGMVFGAYIFTRAGIPDLDAAAFLQEKPSLPVMLTVFFVPFLVSFFSAHFRLIPILLLTVFSKAVMYTFTLAALMTWFSGAGWLVAPLILCSEILTLPLFWLLWLRSMTCGHRLEWAAFAGIGFLVVALNHTFIVPFVSALISA